MCFWRPPSFRETPRPGAQWSFHEPLDQRGNDQHDRDQQPPRNDHFTTDSCGVLRSPIMASGFFSTTRMTWLSTQITATCDMYTA